MQLSKEHDFLLSGNANLLIKDIGLQNTEGIPGQNIMCQRLDILKYIIWLDSCTGADNQRLDFHLQEDGFRQGTKLVIDGFQHMFFKFV